MSSHTCERPNATVDHKCVIGIEAGCFENVLDDAWEMALVAQGKDAQPTRSHPCEQAVILDGQTLRSTVESGARAGYDGGKLTRGSKVHHPHVWVPAVDTLGNLLALTVTPANVQERDQVRALTEQVQAVTGGNVKKAYVDGGYTGDRAAQAAKASGVELDGRQSLRHRARFCCRAQTLACRA